MYNRKAVMLTRLFTAGLTVIVEVLIFYSLFVQFDRVLSGQEISIVLCKDIIFFTVITAMSAWLHEFICCVMDFGDRLEQHGERVWKDSKIIFLEEDDQCLRATTREPKSRRKSLLVP